VFFGKPLPHGEADPYKAKRRSHYANSRAKSQLFEKDQRKVKSYHSGKNAFFALIAGTGLAMLAADFLILLFFGNTFSQLRFRFGIPALIFLGFYCFLLGRGARYFDYKYFTKLDGEQYLLWLKKIGAVPIKRIALNVVTHAAFLGIVFFI
jgi:hypothetical protein